MFIGCLWKKLIKIILFAEEGTAINLRQGICQFRLNHRLMCFYIEENRWGLRTAVLIAYVTLRFLNLTVIETTVQSSLNYGSGGVDD